MDHGKSMSDARSPFELSAYLAANTLAFDAVRRSYSILFVMCGLLLLFLVRVAPVRNLPSLLEYIDRGKSELNSVNGELKALGDYMEQIHEPALGENLNELQSKKRQIIADLYCTVTGEADASGECSTPTAENLRLKALDEATVLKVIDGRRNELLAIGTGFKVPLLDAVIEPQYVPLMSTVLLVVLLTSLRATVRNWCATLSLSLHDARSAGCLKLTRRLIQLNSLFATKGSGGKLRELTRRAAIVMAHMTPLALNGTLLWRHRYVFSDLAGKTSILAVIGYSAGMALILWASLFSAIEIVKAKTLVQALEN
jgi:hypothetical protein